MGIDNNSGRSFVTRPRKGDVILCAQSAPGRVAWRVRSVFAGVVCIVQTAGELKGLVWYMRLTDYVAAFRTDKVLRG